MFLYETKFGDNPTFAPDYADTIATENSQRAAADALWQTTKDLADYRDNSNGEQAAKGEAYERRNKAIFDATGVQLDNPMKFDVFKLKPEPGAAGLPEPSARDDIAAQEQAWYDKASALAREKPEFASVIGIDRPVIEDAYAITRGAETASAAAEQQADAAGLSRTQRLGASLGGGLAGALRDPLQVATLAAGGGISSPARALGWRLLESVFTEGAINGGIEAGVQLSSHDWKKRAGVDASLSTSLKQVGLAALFGGGFGGLLEGGRTVAHLLGAEVPEEVLTRAASGNPEPGDFSTIADAMGVKVDPATVRAADLAAEQPALDREAFGPPPEGLGDDEAAAMAAQALRAVDSPDDVRASAIDRIVSDQVPAVASAPTSSPARTFEILNSDDPVQAAYDLAEKARLSGVDLEDRVLGKETADKFRSAVRRENSSSPATADAAAAERQAIEATLTPEQLNLLDGHGMSDEDTPEWWRHVATTISDHSSHTVAELGANLRSAANDLPKEFKSWDEMGYRERLAAVAMQTVGKDAERLGVPFEQLMKDAFSAAKGRHVDPEDAAFMARDMMERVGAFMRGETPATAEAAAAPERLMLANETPEPATPQAGDLATLALTEARRPAVGEAKPVDLDSGKKLSVWDAMPAAKDADGTIQHATHETMIADADRTEFFGDLIAACKD